MTDKPSKKWIRDYDYAMFEVEYTQTLNEYMDYIKELINEGWEGIELLPQRYDYELYPCPLIKHVWKQMLSSKLVLELAEKNRRRKLKLKRGNVGSTKNLKRNLNLMEYPIKDLAIQLQSEGCSCLFF
jgi:hypothetical protein